MSEQENGVDTSPAEQTIDQNGNNNSFSNYSAYLAWTQYWQQYYTYSFYYYRSYYYFIQCQQGQAHLQNLGQNTSAFSPVTAGNVAGNAPQNLPQVYQRVLNGGVVGHQNLQQPTGHENLQRLRYEYKIASIGKRTLAEFIDFVFLFFIKYLIYSLYYDEPGQISQIQYILIIDENTSLNEIEEILIQALVYRLLVFLYEAFFTAVAFPCSVGGATLGKYMMGITIISYQGLMPIEGQHLRRFHGNIPHRLQPWQACVRAALKNFMVTFFFPIMFTAMFLKNHRTPYDFVASSIVVDANPTPERQT